MAKQEIEDTVLYLSFGKHWIAGEIRKRLYGEQSISCNEQTR
jgi:hypothetical protein